MRFGVCGSGGSELAIGERVLAFRFRVPGSGLRGSGRIVG